MLPHCAPSCAQVLGVHVQSLSNANVQPAGQQPSLFVQAVMVWVVSQNALHVPADPRKAVRVQEFGGGHEDGQLPSQVSPGSTTLLPHWAEQSPSVVSSQLSGQQPSPLTHDVTTDSTQTALQVLAAP